MRSKLFKTMVSSPMEQQCKIGGERLRNRNVVDEDMISKLPEDLLLKILSSVPTKSVVAASVLSKRWRSLWKLVPKLDFYSEDHHHTFTEDVCRSLNLHKAPFLESLHLKIEDQSDYSDIKVWIVTAFERHVREFVLDIFIFNEDEVLVRFPSVWCSNNNTLKVLKLKYHILLDCPSRVCFNALRELDLEYMEFKDEASVCNFLCGCSSLEDLVVRRRENLDVKTFKIAVPSLQRLTIEHGDEGIGDGDGGYVINAPSLKYLNIECLFLIDFCLIESAPELVEAKISDVSDITNENILASLTSAKRLSLHFPLEVTYPTGSIFYQLVSLELLIDNINWWNLLLFMLHSSPKLQILKLISVSNYHNLYSEDGPVGWEWNQPKCVPECLLFHFETFMWTTYEWQREAEKQVAKYILKNARLLKKATFSTKPIKLEELEKLEKRHERLNELASVVRSSNSCRLVFETK